MDTVLHLRSGVCALVALLLLSVSADTATADQCDNGADNCNKWTETSHNRPLNTETVTYTCHYMTDRLERFDLKTSKLDLLKKKRHLHLGCPWDDVVMYEQLKDMMSTGSVQLFDVREPDELEAGFIPGATNIPLGDVEQALRLNPDQFRESYGVPKPGLQDSDFVLYCRRGIRSLTALETARDVGYSRARHYAGGYNEWIQLEPQ